MVIDFGYDRAYSSLKALYVNASDKAYCEKRWAVWNEYGIIAIVFAHHEQEALDVIVDESTKLDSCLVEFSEANFEDCCSLGGAGELFNLDYIGMKEI